MKTNSTPLTFTPTDNSAMSLESGIDELNLAEFPLASISQRRLDGKKTILFEEPLFDRNEGRTVMRRLTISGSDRYGLPLAMDDDVLLACMQLSKLQDFQSRTVTFSRYEILKMLRLPDSSANYARIAISLRRWKGLTIFSDRAFYDHQHKAWINRDFGIFDNLYIYSREADGPNSTAQSRFTWNEVLFASFQAGYLKRLDWKLYTSLGTPLAKRMYRFLDKRFYHRGSFSMDLREFAVNRMGLPAAYNTSQLKRGLAKAIEELEQAWQLRPMRAEQRFGKQGRGQWVIHFQRRKQSSVSRLVDATPTAVTNNTNDDASSLECKLVKRGIGPATAEELVQNHSLRSVQTMLELFDWYNQRGQSRGAGFLVQAIKKSHTIELPSGFESSHQIEARRTAASQHAKIKDETTTRRERLASQREQARLDAFASYWESLSPAEQTRFEDEAIEQAEPTKRHGYYRNQGREGPVFEQYRQVILRDHYERRDRSAATR